MFHPKLDLLLLTILIAAVITSCGSRSGHTRLPIGYVDAPALSGQAALHGKAIFEGWALADDGLKSSDIWTGSTWLQHEPDWTARMSQNLFPTSLTQARRVGEPRWMSRI